jgi:hypothetical protein
VTFFVAGVIPPGSGPDERRRRRPCSGAAHHFTLQHISIGIIRPALPASFILDAKGVICYKDVRGKEPDEAVGVESPGRAGEMRNVALIGLHILIVGSAGCGKDPPKEDYSVSGFVTQLKDKDPNMRYSAARSLGKFGPEAKAAIPALVESLKGDESPLVRMGAAYALGDMGADAAEALPALKQAANDRDPEVRKAAAYAVKHIQLQAKN